MDMYVFAYSWQPEFCDGKTGYEIWLLQSSPLMEFTLHGLWPQYSSGGYPSYCTTEPFDPSVPDNVGWTDMTTSWPNAQYATTAASHLSPPFSLELALNCRNTIISTTQLH
jgi:ribonuclease I